MYKRQAVIKSDTNSISRQLLKLKDIHKQLKFQAQVQELQELRDEMQDDIDVVSKKAKEVRWLEGSLLCCGIGPF